MDDILNIILLGLLAVAGFRLLVWWAKPRESTGVITLGGQEYAYTMGDALRGGSPNSYRGIEIVLPKALPHIYIDGHAADGFLGPRFTFPAKYRLGLEGDFDKHFQVYTLPVYKSLALSILTPDVMATLIDHGSQYDVEIFENRLRVITKRRVHKHPARELDLLDVSKVVLDEIAHRLVGWKADDSVASGNARMLLMADPTIKFGRRSASSSTVGWALFFAPIGGSLMASAIWYEPRWFLIATGIMFFPGFWLYLVVGQPRGWLKWLDRF